jgi:putative peptidoglycan lipid II flippase
LAYAIAYSAGAVLALVSLGRRLGGLDGRRTLDSVARMVVAAAVMAAAVWGLTQVVGDDSGGGAVTRTLLGVLVGAVVYFAVLFALRVPEVVEVRDRLRPVGSRP